jgi:hypothetical protein
MAQSRSYMDGSSCLFNFFCVSPVANRLSISYLNKCRGLTWINRWMIRTAYDIQGDACNGNCFRTINFNIFSDDADCYVATFCPCCTANQLYQTTKERGQAVSNGGAVHNTDEFRTSLGAGNFKDCLYSFFCMPCAVGSMMESGIGMPFYLG